MKRIKLIELNFNQKIFNLIATILFWRGIWYLFDIIDNSLFQGHRIWTALFGIIIGLIILFFPFKKN